MSAAENKLVTVAGKQFTVWMGPAGPIEVTTAAHHTRMGFRRVPLTSKSAKAAIAKATAQHPAVRCAYPECGGGCVECQPRTPGAVGMVKVGVAIPGSPVGDIFVSETLIAQRGAPCVRRMVRETFNAAHDAARLKREYRAAVAKIQEGRST
ncbi:hypothetical protein [Variovorax boronicumulans]|uniref:hypothetical protein n=1 Tax=Variovorax boronicumulans TaxID=436515 RepID=UPI0012E6BC3B|nr:hypothetical protein [Variovorax boronicumulans]GER16723.1 hypothetical protein VCH24_17300 [Variovorax boronicumulans]